ncbi:outer membrane protein [Brucella sp. IR073]|uniref:outer membrane protein n=1 Tax=unclassified Brucella TaxID=2632610 RepID=UPI003B9822D1
MKRIKRIFIAALSSPLLAAPAFAADLGPVPVETPVTAEPVAAVSGWYLRGDVGHSFDAKGDGRYGVWDEASHTKTEFDYDEIELRGNTDFSVGVGYRFNQYLRADATLGYWKRDVFGSSEAFGGAVTFDDTSKVSAWEMMANAYIDLITWGKVTPYIGGGLGVTRLKYGTMKNRSWCHDVNVCGDSYWADHGGFSSTRFTWALMAGMSVDITSSTKLDFGYRYSHIKGGKAFGWDASDIAAGATGVQGYDKGFDVHQVRVGLRYEFGGPEAAYQPEPLPAYGEPALVYKN